MLATPLYSNTTLVCFIPTLSGGGTVVLMPKFDTRRYLELASKHRATHTMLVPVQYQRLMDEPTFDNYDLSSFEKKFCTSAPFSAALKAEVLRRWPGGLIEYFGMTEGGGTWQLVDATGMADPAETVKIGVGRDAADVSFLTSFGPNDFRRSSVSVSRED